MLNWLLGHRTPRITMIIPNVSPRVYALVASSTDRIRLPIVAWALIDHGSAQSVSGVAVEGARLCLIPATEGRFERYIEAYEEADL